MPIASWAAGVSRSRVHAVAGRGGVTEHGEPDRRPAAADARRRPRCVSCETGGSVSACAMRRRASLISPISDAEQRAAAEPRRARRGRRRRSARDAVREPAVPWLARRRSMTSWPLVRHRCRPSRLACARMRYSRLARRPDRQHPAGPAAHASPTGLAPPVLAKVEYFNPGGSVKDRIAVRMIDAAEAVRRAAARRHDRRADQSGNTGVGLAIVAQQRGYRCVFVCPDKVAADKINVLRAYGAEVVVCPTAVAPEDPRSYYSVSDRLARETPGGWKPDQYSNPNNPRSHYETTGPEIWEQTDGPDHPLRRRHRHRRHDQRHRPLPQGGVRRPGAGHRRRPGGLGVLRRHRPALPGRGRRRGLLADDLRPRRSPTRSSRSPTATPSP